MKEILVQVRQCSMFFNTTIQLIYYQGIKLKKALKGAFINII